MELQGVLALGEGDFAGGVQAAYGLEARERTRQQAAIAMYQRKFHDLSVSKEELKAAMEEKVYAGPLWLRVLGFDPTVAADVAPEQRRLGIRKLIRVVERMYRAEMKTEDRAGAIATDSTDVSERYDGPSALWDPLPEICAYLGIAVSKLSALCRERTGLRVQELGDCIRTERLKTRLRDRFRELARVWHETLDADVRGKLADDGRTSAWRFVRWVRGCGRGESRKKLALELGVPTAARLGRSTFVVERATLEELELSVAMDVVTELAGGAQGETVAGTPSGAELSDVHDEAQRQSVEVGEGRTDSKGEGEAA